MTSKIAIGCLAATLLSASAARANGRFPEANQIATTTADDKVIVVRASFGLLVSRDAGKTFSWICEPAMGYGGTQDPGIAVMADGSLVVSAFEGLIISNDGGCTWGLVATEGLAKEYVIDVAAERTEPQNAVVVTSTGKEVGVFNVQVFRTTDNAKTWTPTGPALDTDILAETVDVAPSDPKRLYVSGEVGQGKDRKGVLATSEDGGVTWTRADVELLGDQQLFIAGVDPVDAKRVYLRTVGVLDRLIVSKDAGKTFQSVLSVTRPMTGFAVSPDGAVVTLGGPDVGWPPGEKPEMTTTRKPLLLSADRDALMFSAVATKTSQCLAWPSVGFLACGEQNNDSYVVGKGASATGNIGPLLPKLADIQGPLACPATAPVTKLCAPAWPALKASFGGGTGGQSSTGGGGSSPASVPATAPKDTGCGCMVSGDERVPALGIVALLLARLRRKRVTSRTNQGSL